MQIKRFLEELNIECFVPMKYELDESESLGGEKLVPAIHNLIFIRSTQDIITRLKTERMEFAPLRYMMCRSQEGNLQIMKVPEKQMEDFIRVTESRDRDVFYVSSSNYINAIGRKVRITAGQFQGVVGVIKRIKRNRCVVVKIQGVAAVAIAHVPSRFVEEV